MLLHIYQNFNLKFWICNWKEKILMNQKKIQCVYLMIQQIKIKNNKEKTNAIENKNPRNRNLLTEKYFLTHLVHAYDNDKG